MVHRQTVHLNRDGNSPEDTATDGRIIKRSKTHRIPGQRDRTPDRKDRRRDQRHALCKRHHSSLQNGRYLCRRICGSRHRTTIPYSAAKTKPYETNDRKKVLVLGSGPIRIGQGIEFDFCSVHCTWAFAKEGYETIIINNNPETVSTDFDIADKLYFEPLTPEDVESIVNLEKPDGAVVQFGGQTAIKLTEALMKMGVPHPRNHPQRTSMRPKTVNCSMRSWRNAASHGRQADTVFTAEEAKKAANELGYPVLRPSILCTGRTGHADRDQRRRCR